MDNGVVEGSCPSLALGAESCTTAEALGAAGCTQGVEAVYLVVPVAVRAEGTRGGTGTIRATTLLLLKPIIIIEDSYIIIIEDSYIMYSDFRSLIASGHRIPRR